jgi:3-methyladenine DNA glycosylase/8-oxoguanine DNA glycosylase
MDVEKTIEFLLENQARFYAMLEAEAERARADAERARAEKEQAKEQAGEDKRRIKEEMDGIRQILQETTLIQREQARILVRIESQTERHKEEIGDIRQILADLAGKLQALIESLRHGRNGGGAVQP